MSKPVIFTDLDGSLLNHEDYSYKGAIPALNEIKKRKIPLIVVSSKTRIEIENLLKELNFSEPFIVENGAAIFFPSGYRGFHIDCKKKNSYCVIELGKSYRYIRKVFEELKKKYPVRGFGDMSIEEIAELTNLPLEKAKLSKVREYTEPFIISDKSIIPELEEEVEKYGLKITKGGRFYHLIGKEQDKGKAVKTVIHIFTENIGNIISVGIGDSKNDIPMLQVVDIPVLIRKTDGSYEDINLKNLIKSEFPGSKGWNQAVLYILKKLNS